MLASFASSPLEPWPYPALPLESTLSKKAVHLFSLQLFLYLRTFPATFPPRILNKIKSRVTSSSFSGKPRLSRMSHLS